VNSTADILDASAIRQQHRTLLLGLLWKERSVSRADLARRTGLSRSTVSAIVGELLETGLVHTTGEGDSSGGRRPIMLAFSDDAYAIVGVDLGATHVAVAITNLRGEVRGWRHEMHAVQADPSGTLDVTKGLIRLALTDAGVELDRVLGIGVAVPSPVSPARPGRLNPLIVPAWEGVDLVDVLEHAFRRPVLVHNDADAGALAERWWGQGRTRGDLAYVKIATGIGAGLLLDGRIYRGHGGVAGEIGHTSIDPDGPRCICGLNGCLNVLVGGPQLIARAAAVHAAHPDPERAPPDSIDDIVDAALDGDPTARAVLLYAGELLGIGIANLLNLLNPAVVVLGGGITRAGEHLLGPIRTVLEHRSLHQSIAPTELVASELGKVGIALGAATSVLEAALEEPRMFDRPPLAVGGAR
jgi:predicted NBD/HSP70 family sugar kinase